MEKNCLYCQTHFTTNRKNKKYCSDTCKQMAYFKRNGLVLSGGTKEQEVKYSTPVFIKEEPEKEQTVKYVLETSKIKSVKQNENIKSVLENKPSDKAIEQVLKQFMISIEQKFNLSIENLKQEFAIKYESLIVKPNFTENENSKHVCKQVAINGLLKTTTESQTKINYCNPCTDISERFISQTHFTVAPTKESKADFTEVEKNNHPLKIIPLIEDDTKMNDHDLLELERNEELEEQKTEQAEEEENTAELRKQELDNKLQKLEMQFQKENISSIKEEQPEQEYKWVVSKFIKQVEKNYEEHNTEYLFKRAFHFGDYNSTKNLNWINVRLRCLIESMIKLSNCSSIDKHTLLCITDAFNRLVKSNAYQTLPDHYPYKELIKELCIKLNQLVRNNTGAETLKFTLSLERKASLIAIRYEMIKYTPAMKFSEIDFIEPDNSYSIKTDEEERVKKPDWKIRYEAIKRQRLKVA